MHLTENVNMLSGQFPEVCNKIKTIEKAGISRAFKTEIARNGLPVILYESDSGSVYLHSKYDPVKEAERFIGQYNDIDRFKHVFFYGIGMGYHIEEFCRRWPDKSFTVYEPMPSILLSLLRERQLKFIIPDNCAGFYTGGSQGDIEYILQQYVNQISGEVLFIILPSYERVFGESCKSFIEAFRTAVMNKKATLNAESHFQKLWAINSIRNFKEVINSANILQYKRFFAGKPAIIAAAGPSLEEELENLRYIRDNGLAYIFSAGSAINTLLSDNIMPHAACVYDPGAHTGEVIKIVKEKGKDIPLIFGSSVYEKTLENYPGSKLHMITSQDTISPFFLRHKNQGEPEKIIDAPSIAIITLQMLIKLGCSPIILVGQNFAFKNNRYYAKDINYKARPEVLCRDDLDNVLETEDVHGGRVLTNQSLYQMKKQMEMYISHSGCKYIINSTKGGAGIYGTSYKPLEELLKRELTIGVVDERWIEDLDFPYDIDYMISRGKLMAEERAAAERLVAELIDTVNMMKSEHNIKLLKKCLSKFEAAYNKLVGNKFFIYILLPMNRVQFEMISKNIPDMSAIRDITEKARFIAKIFDDAFEACKKDMNEIQYDFYDMIEEIMENDIKVMTFTVKVS